MIAVNAWTDRGDNEAHVIKLTSVEKGLIWGYISPPTNLKARQKLAI